MSIKFAKDGAVFPTEVVNGELLIHFGEEIIRRRLGFLKEDFPLNNVAFPMSNIMCYLSNEEHTIVMRFDGSMTKYDIKKTVIGFSKFNAAEIRGELMRYRVGCVGVMGKRFGKEGIIKNIPCNVYKFPETTHYAFECVEDPEPIVWLPEDNPMYVEDVRNGTVLYPRMLSMSMNTYAREDGAYVVKGEPMRKTGYVVL